MRYVLSAVVTSLALGGSLFVRAETSDPTGTTGGNGLLPEVYWSNQALLEQGMRGPLKTGSDNLTAELSRLPQTREGKKLLEYAIDCAVRGPAPRGAGSFTARQLLNTTGGWLKGALDQSQREDLHACIAARLNPTGAEVFIWLGGPHVTNDPSVRIKQNDFPIEEAFWAAVEEPPTVQGDPVSNPGPVASRDPVVGEPRVAQSAPSQDRFEQPAAEQSRGVPPVVRDHRAAPARSQVTASPVRGRLPVAQPLPRPGAVTAARPGPRQVSPPPRTLGPGQAAPAPASQQVVPDPPTTRGPRSGPPEQNGSQLPKANPSTVTLHVWPSAAVRASCAAPPSYPSKRGGNGSTDEKSTKLTELVSARGCGRSGQASSTCRLIEHTEQDRDRLCVRNPITGWSCRLQPEGPLKPVIETRMMCKDWCSIYPGCSLPKECLGVASECGAR